MKKRRGIGKIITALVLLVAVCIFAVFASGIKIGFIENYTYNFKINILALAKNLGIELSDPVLEYLQDLPEPEYIEEKPPVEQDEPPVSEIETAEDIPDIEFEDLVSDDDKAKSTPLALEDAATYKYAKYRDYILCVNETSVLAFNDKGKSLWGVGIHMSEPILGVGGDYYMIAERGGRKIQLFDGKRLVYETETDGDIKNASISENGDVVIVSDKEYYKGAVTVINKRGDKVFAWNSGTDSIIDADIAAGSRRVAISLLNTDTGANSKVKVFNISNGKEEADTAFEGSIIFDVDFLGEVVNLFADDKVAGVSQRGKVLWTIDYSEKEFLYYSAENNGYKLLLADNNNSAELSVATSRGKQKSLILPEKKPDCIDIRSGRVAYNSGRDLIFSGLSGRRKMSHTCPREIRDIHILSDNSVMVVYSSGIDFIEF